MTRTGCTLLAGVLLASSGCTGSALNADTRHIDVLTSWPLCEHVRLGPVQGRDGHGGHMSGSVWGGRGSIDKAMQRLRLATMDLGGDAVILVQRQIEDRENHGSSLTKRPARRVMLRGIAIRGCRPELSKR